MGNNGIKVVVIPSLWLAYNEQGITQCALYMAVVTVKNIESEGVRGESFATLEIALHCLGWRHLQFTKLLDSLGPIETTK